MTEAIEHHECPHVRAGERPWLDLICSPIPNRSSEPNPPPTRNRLCRICSDASIMALMLVRVPPPTPKPPEN